MKPQHDRRSPPERRTIAVAAPATRTEDRNGLVRHAGANAGGAMAPRGHLTDAAYRHVKDLILDGRAKPGERLDVNGIVSALAASRQPVMTALRRLAGEGFVDIAPQSGCRVSTPDRDAVGDFFRAFAAVEGVAAEIAAERTSPGGLLELESINERIGELDRKQRLAAAERGRRYRLANQRFHRKIHEMARSESIAAVAEGFWDKADFYIQSTLGLSPFATRIGVSFEEHHEIISAIRRQSGGEARRLMEAHIRAFAAGGR